MPLPLKVYGVPFSQPVRALLWLLLLKRLPFELVPTNPGSTGESGSRNPAYLAKHPGGTIPCIEEVDTGVFRRREYAFYGVSDVLRKITLRRWLGHWRRRGAR